MINRRQIDGAREVRLWIGQVLIPVAMAAIFICSNPDARNWVSDKVEKAKSLFKKKN